MYSLHPEVVKGTKIVAALQNCHLMPSVHQVLQELDYVVECVKDTEKFYGVAFRMPVSKDVKKDPNQFEAIQDVRNHLREFYFGGNQERDFGFQINAFYKLIVEPLLDSMEHCSHDELLDNIENVVEQIKEHIIIADATNNVDSSVMYKQYRDIVAERQMQKKVQALVSGIMRYRGIIKQ